MNWNPDEPLSRYPAETLKSNNALRDYFLMGAGRSIRKLHRGYIESASIGESIPTRHLRTLLGWSSRYHWQARIQREQDIDFAKDKEARQLRRRQLLDGFVAKTAQALGKLNVDGATLGQLTHAVRMAVQELRAEYDELPTQRHEISGAGDDGEILIREVIVELPINEHLED